MLLDEFEYIYRAVLMFIALLLSQNSLFVVVFAMKWEQSTEILESISMCIETQ